MKTICVFCSASDRVDDEYKRVARELGEALARKNHPIVYGGASIGLMGILADSALKANGRVTGVIPEYLKSKEIAHNGLSALHITQTMQERQRLMADLCDVFIALPGGIGTYAELFEAISLKQVGEHKKPIFLLNTRGYWDKLLLIFDDMQNGGFLHGSGTQALFEIVPDVKTLEGKL